MKLSCWLRSMFLVFIAFSFSFGQSLKAQSADSQKDPLSFSNNWGSRGFFIPNIVATNIAREGLCLPDPFSSQLFLKRCFPRAKFYHIPDIKSGGVLWRSSNYAINQNKHPLSDDKHAFPLPEGNYTTVYNVFRFKDNYGVSWLIVVLESKEVMPLQELECCIPDGADMSLALFRKTDTGWVLTNFTMAAGNYGRWHKLDGVDLVKFGPDNYGVVVSQHWRSPGGPSGGIEHYYGLVNGQFKNILNVDDVYYWESACCDWTGATSVRKADKKFNDIDFVIRSEYHRVGTQSDMPSFLDSNVILPLGMKQYVTANTDSVKYKFVTKYTFNGYRYIQKQNLIRILYAK